MQLLGWRSFLEAYVNTSGVSFGRPTWKSKRSPICREFTVVKGVRGSTNFLQPSGGIQGDVVNGTEQHQEVQRGRWDVSLPSVLYPSVQLVLILCLPEHPLCSCAPECGSCDGYAGQMYLLPNPRNLSSFVFPVLLTPWRTRTEGSV